MKTQYIIRTILVILLLLAINFAASVFNFFVDLTEDKKFTLSDSTVSLVENVDNNIYVRILLDGELPAGFKRLKSSIEERMDQFRSVNSYIEYAFEDPDIGTLDEINQRREMLKEMGMSPVRLTVVDGSNKSEKYIYPYAIVNYGQRTTVVNLLEEQTMSVPQEVTLNNSVNLIEYKLASAIEKLVRVDRPNIVVSDGHGETSEKYTAKLEQELKPFFDIGRIHLDSIYQLDQEAHLLIVPAPKTKLREKTQFVIDQYIMNGGKVIWMIENFEVNVDSINGREFFVPKPIEHGLEDLLFKYGVRMEKNLVMDLECSQIPQVVGNQGGKPQMMLFPWYYHPVSSPKIDHPIVKSLDRVNFKFPSSIKILENESGIEATPLLSSSDYTRYQVYPMRLNFEMLRIEPDAKKFNKGNLNFAVLLEGEFESYFKNRVTQENKRVLEEIGTQFLEKSSPTKQIVISDADFMQNQFDSRSNRISPVGYNQWEQKEYPGNGAFIRNAIEFMLDDYGLLESRSKDFKLRLLDKVKTEREKVKWQFINIVLPIIIVWLFAFLYARWRKGRFA